MLVRDGYKCPAFVNKANWFGGESNDDNFSVTHNGNEITIKRTDRDSGWSHQLEFKCCSSSKHLRNTLFLI